MVPTVMDPRRWQWLRNSQRSEVMIAEADAMDKFRLYLELDINIDTDVMISFTLILI